MSIGILVAIAIPAVLFLLAGFGLLALWRRRKK